MAPFDAFFSQNPKGPSFFWKGALQKGFTTFLFFLKEKNYLVGALFCEGLIVFFGFKKQKKPSCFKILREGPCCKKKKKKTFKGFGNSFLSFFCPNPSQGGIKEEPFPGPQP